MNATRTGHREYTVELSTLTAGDLKEIITECVGEVIAKDCTAESARDLKTYGISVAIDLWVVTEDGSGHDMSLGYTIMPEGLIDDPDFSRLSPEVLEIYKEVELSELDTKVVKWADAQLDLYSER
jgi:hypothetical protein